MNITFLFTYGVSMEEWEDRGLFERELLLYRRLSEAGHSINFITYGSSRDLMYKERIGNISIFPIYCKITRSRYKVINLLKSFLVPFKFREVFKKTDIIKTNQMNGSWIGVMAKYLYGKKFIVRCGFEWYRNAYVRRSKRFSLLKNILMYALEFAIYHACDKIVISNETDAEFIKNTFWIKSGKINLIRNYVDTGLFRPLEKIEKDDKGLIYLGRFEARKNIMNLLDAVKGTSYRLDIAGYGEERDRLESYARANKLNVRFLGLIPNQRLPELLNKYYVMVIVSLYENSPKALLEGMSCGLSVIGTDVPGIREVIRHGKNGFLCGTDAPSIRRAIELVMENTVLRNNTSKSARQYVLENCDIEVIFKKECEIYKSLSN